MTQPFGRSGARSFDFLLGRWIVHNRKLHSPLEPDSSDWAEFISHVTNQALLGGLGNLDTYVLQETPSQRGFEALALRLFDQSENVWRIWWASTLTSGRIDTPVVGAFHDDHGVFECDDVIAGTAAVRCRPRCGLSLPPADADRRIRQPEQSEREQG